MMGWGEGGEKEKEEKEEEEGKCAFVGCTRRGGGGGKGDKVTSAMAQVWNHAGWEKATVFFSFPLLCANSLR